MLSEKLNSDLEALIDEHKKLDVRLRSALGDDGLFSLVHRYGGTRLYVPSERIAQSDIINALTIEQAELLSRAFGGSYMRVPLCRDFMAVQFLKRNYSTREIARSFAMTESGVERLKKRLRANGELPLHSAETADKQTKEPDRE